MSFNDPDYQRLADAIVTDFISKGVPLEENTIKAANDSNMNVHETRRLVEATNLSAHLTLFSKMAEHRYVDFDVVDPEVVCDRLFADPSRGGASSGVASSSINGVKIAEDLRLTVPDERWEELRARVMAANSLEFSKVAHEVAPKEVDKYGGAKFHAATQHVKKAHDEIRTRLYAAYVDYEEKVAALKHAFTFVDAPSLSRFEKEAYSILPAGDVSKVLAKGFGLRPTEKTASSREYVVETKHHALLRTAIASMSEARKHAAALEHLEAQMAAAGIKQD